MSDQAQRTANPVAMLEINDVCARISDAIGDVGSVKIIVIEDCGTWSSGGTWLTIEEARAVRDWLIKVLA